MRQADSLETPRSKVMGPCCDNSNSRDDKWIYGADFPDSFMSSNSAQATENLVAIAN